MALMEIPTYAGGGGGINPTAAFKETYNTPKTSETMSAASGKTYMVSFVSGGSSTEVGISGGDKIDEIVSNGFNVSGWGATYGHFAFFKATSSSVTISDTAGNNMWDLVMIQLD